MKFLLFILFLFTCLVAGDRKLSHILPSEIKVISINTQLCDRDCQMSNLKNGQYFSFLEFYTHDDELDVYYQKLVKHLNISIQTAIQSSDFNKSSIFKLAILIPSKIAKQYTNTIYNSVISYLISKKIDYDVQVFDCIDDNFLNIQRSINDIHAKQYRYILAPFRKNMVDILNKNSKNSLIYIPTVSKDNNKTFSPNIVFGGLNYDEHIELIANATINKKIVLISSDSLKSKELKEKLINHIPFNRILTLNSKGSNIDSMISKNKRFIQGSVFVLNTPLIKGSSIISKLKFYGIYSRGAYSLQTLYNPMIFELLQQRELKRVSVTNSISDVEDIHIVGTNELLNNNIEFNWINYSSLIGVDYLHSIYSSEKRLFQEEILSSQVIYQTKLLKTKNKQFVKVNK